jgi:hypothetical protein
VRPLGDCVCEGCGKEYWRNQAWQHDKCVVHKLVANVVVNKPKVVANKDRKKDRHKNKAARLEYARNLMRKRRATKEAQA